MLSGQQFRVYESPKKVTSGIIGKPPKNRPITRMRGTAPRRAIGKSWKSAVPKGRSTL